MFLKKKSAVRKIFKTTDGFFNNKPHIKKPRLVVAIHQRKNDGALAVVKIFSKKEKNGNSYIPNLTLHPNKHNSLSEDSIVGKKIIWGINKGDNNFAPIFPRDLIKTSDKISLLEHAKVKKGIQSINTKYKKTYSNTLHKWKKKFKK